MTTLNDLRKCPVVYLGTNYTDYHAGLDEAAERAAEIASRLMERGLRVFSPICHSHAIAMAGSLDPKDPEFWREQDAWAVDAASALVVAKLPGWEESRGLAHEIAAFEAAGKPVVYIDPEGV